MALHSRPVYLGIRLPPLLFSQLLERWLLVLSSPDLRRELESENLVFDPAIEPDQLAQVSIDLRLGVNFSRFRRPAYLPAIHVDSSLWDSNDLWEDIECPEGETFRLGTRDFVLAQTLERVTIPGHLVGLVEGRSSWARVGVTIHVTAPKIDPGFTGRITLEMANFGGAPVDLRPCVDKPAQLILMRISTPLDEAELYGTGEDDLFQGQEHPIPRA